MTGVVEEAHSRVCSRTKLRLVPPPSHTVYRIGKTKYGAMNPQRRGSGADRKKWGRWDTENGRTLYVGATALAAFAEVLPYLREHLPETGLGDLFDDATQEEAGLTLAETVRAEMPCMDLRDVVVQGWRLDRAVYELRLPSRGWFVDVHAAESLAAINEALFPHRRPVGDLTLSDLAGEDRNLTSRVAEWIRSQVLDDGTEPLGIQYVSKHGSNLPVYAVWLRALDDGKRLSSEPTQKIFQRPVLRYDPDLWKAAGWNRLRVF